MKQFLGYYIVLLSGLGLSAQLLCAPESSSEEVQITELPLGIRNAPPEGKLPFKLVPVDLEPTRASNEPPQGSSTYNKKGATASQAASAQAAVDESQSSGKNTPVVIRPDAQARAQATSSAAPVLEVSPGTPQKAPEVVTTKSSEDATGKIGQLISGTTVQDKAQIAAATAPASSVATQPLSKAVEPATSTKEGEITPRKAASDIPILPNAPVVGLPAQVSMPSTAIIAPAAEASTPTIATEQASQTAPKPEKKANVKQVPMKREKSKRLIDRRQKKVAKSMADAPITEEEAAEQVRLVEEAEEERKNELTDTSTAFETLAETGGIYLGQYLEPWKGFDPNERVEMNFDNKELTELLKFLSNTFDVTFILDDAIEPLRAEGLQPMAGTKITFKSQVPLTLQQAWEIGLTFIEMAGFSVIPSTQSRTYRVTVSSARDKPSANREPLPTFIGSDPELIPNNDTKIRYVYFAENAELSTIIQIIEAMKSGSAGPLIEVPPLRAIIMTDKAANIRSLISILQEIDRVSLPETLAIIRLRHTDARQVRELYYKLIGKDPQNPMFNPFSRQRKPSTTQYFTEATRVFEEPYTNSLIVLGTRENIKRFEDFILKYVDKTLDIPFSPLHVIQLKYMDAASIAKILNEIIQKFNADPSNTAAALVGGVRDTNKFFRPTVRITEETSGNRLIINADYDEYLKIRELIEKLDVEQPQVAIKILILDVDLTNSKQLGVQLRNKVDCCDGTGGSDLFLGKNVNFQTGNLGPIVTLQPAQAGTPVNGAERLLGNLIGLANQVSGVSPFQAGTTLLSLGKDLFGFWGLLTALESYTRVSVVANPFLTVTNKYKAEFKVGETRRTTTAIVEGQREAQAQGDLSADLRIIVTPQISFDDMVTLNVYVELGTFIDQTTQNRLIKRVSTEALLANREVLALGGLIKDTIIENTTKVPFFGDIPGIGWFFKNKTKSVERSSLLILICPEIIKPYEPEVAQNFTYSKIADAKENLYSMRSTAERRDPIHRWFFGDHKDKEASSIDKFVSTQQRYIDESQRKIEIVAHNNSSQSKTGTASQKKDSAPKKGLLDLISDQSGARA